MPSTARTRGFAEMPKLVGVGLLARWHCQHAGTSLSTIHPLPVPAAPRPQERSVGFAQGSALPPGSGSSILRCCPMGTPCSDTGPGVGELSCVPSGCKPPEILGRCFKAPSLPETG